ncbi:MAG TPA: hypothetical protein VGC41_07530 [Kofleriaceae bacterium]
MRAVLLLALFGACTDDAYLVVTVNARSTVHDVTKLAVTQMNNGTSRTDVLDVSGHEFPATFSISVAGRAGEIDLALEAKSADDTVVGVGSASAMLETKAADVQLDPADFVVNTDYAMDEFLTTDYETVGYQLSATSAGNWTAAFRSTCSDTCNVFGRTFGPDGLPVRTAAAAGTNAYTVTSATTQNGAFPALASNGTATLAVWDFSDTVGAGTGVACRGIDATGALTPGQLSLTTEAADTVTVAAIPNGNFAVSWQVYAPAHAIHTIIAKPDCTVSGAIAVVSNLATATDGPYRSSVAANGSTMLYAWISDDVVRVRPKSTALTTFSAAEAVLVAAPTGQTAQAVRVAPLGATDFAVAIRYIATNGGPGQIVIAHVSSAGVLMGVPAVVTDKSGSDFTNGRRGFGIAHRADGVSLVVWGQCDDGSAGACDGRLDVYGRTVDDTGTPQGAPFLIPTTTLGSQTDPSVIALPDGFAVAWTDDSKVGVDTDGTAVRARVIYP